MHQCNGSKGELLIWKNRIFWMKFAISRQRWNWTYLKFLLQPETIYLPVVSNFQHLPTSVEKTTMFLSEDKNCCLHWASDKLRPEKETNCRTLLAAKRTITICLKQVHLRKEEGGAFIVCHLHRKEGHQLLFETLTCWDASIAFRWYFHNFYQHFKH